ncbi:AMP-binding protein [Enterobacteriaceae bacterium H4N4]|uniref:AMP-binding protein n=1 Tax=Silvania confinis TaxID=2926470 RepID=A0A9J6QDB1_9ENTR|nr:AMP-binding protein [Silvania confinis]MCU6667358.1 AMP-binding protein [Silvania confinis]
MPNLLPLCQWLNAPRPDDTPVAWCGDRCWTLGQLRYDVSTLTTDLQQQRGERWALCLDDSYLFLVALLATLHAGKTPVIPGHSRLLLLEKQRALFDGVLSDRPLRLSGPLRVVRSSQRNNAPFHPLPAVADAAFIELFTSGSTGAAKRVVKTLTALDREAALLATFFGDRLHGCRVVASVAPYHQYGLTFRLFLPLAQGLVMHSVTIAYSEQLAALDPQYRYLFISSPAFLKRIDAQLASPPVAVLFSAGGSLAWDTVDKTHRWLNIWPDEIYGSTETGVLAWRHYQHEGLCWRPLPGIHFHQDKRGLRVSSPLIPHGEGLPLDDVLQFDDTGGFSLVGRKDRLVKIEEKRISLNEIEQYLRALEGVCDAAALPITRNGRQGIGALLVLNDAAREQLKQRGNKAQLQAWRRALRPWLDPVAVPRDWRIVDEIPVNSMNKRIYAQLQELFHENP